MKRDAENRIKDTCHHISIERYKAFIENISDGVYEVDLEGNFIYFNDALCKVFGYPREDIQWQNFAKFMDEEQAKTAFKIFNNIYKTGKGISNLLWKIIDKEGNRREIELSADLILNKEGEKVGFRGIARDVTDRIKIQEALRESERNLQRQFEKAKRAEKRYRMLLDFIPYPMVVFRLDGTVFYLNPAFEETFGWKKEELIGKKIPYVPPDLEQETIQSIKELLKHKMVARLETKRLTKDGRLLDVVLRGVIFSEDDEEEGGELVILRDITEEKRIARINQALLRISLSLPRYQNLEELLDFVAEEVKGIMDVEGAFVILLDKEKNEFFFFAVSYDDQHTKYRAKEVRFPADRGISGRVLKTGKEAIVNDTSKDPDFHPFVDRELGLTTKSMLSVPLRGREETIGILTAINKKSGRFDKKDAEILNMIASTVALSIENTRFSTQLKQAYEELASLNRAKDKVINHLSHELKTPISVLLASLNIISKKISKRELQDLKPTIDRAYRNLQRLLDIQYQVEDIMRDGHYRAYPILKILYGECRDELEALIEEELGSTKLMDRVREKIDEIFATKESIPEEIDLVSFVKKRLKELRPRFTHREVEIEEDLERAPSVFLPSDVLQKIVDGLIKNAIENTPDEGKIKISVKPKGDGTLLEVHDYGVGITEEYQKRIFEGFFATQDTIAYSSKNPFDFNAGGRGADLLRIKIFSERYGFKIELRSKRCRYLPRPGDICPGRISKCNFCSDRSDCYASGDTIFSVFFPATIRDGERIR